MVASVLDATEADLSLGRQAAKSPTM